MRAQADACESMFRNTELGVRLLYSTPPPIISQCVGSVWMLTLGGGDAKPQNTQKANPTPSTDVDDRRRLAGRKVAL